MLIYVCVCVRACVRACVCACVRIYVCLLYIYLVLLGVRFLMLVSSGHWGVFVKFNINVSLLFYAVYRTHTTYIDIVRVDDAATFVCIDAHALFDDHVT